MENDGYKDITAVTANWLSAENTKRAILSFQKFYPDIPVIVVDDASKPEDKSLFWQTYNRDWNNSDMMYDPVTDKLKNMKGVTFLEVPSYDREEAKGHGRAIDMAIDKIKTKWMFHFHSDWRMTSVGILEEMTFELDDKVCAVGEDKTRTPNLRAISSVAGLYNIWLGKLHKLSFKPVIYHSDGTTSPFPESSAGEGDMAVEAGAYYVGKLVQLGYKIKYVSNPHQRYGVHLRWKGDEWNGDF